MRMQLKNKKGFTLVEMILSLAIICIIGGVIAGICVSISDSFSTTYNIDDSTDYAMLYANGFENSVLSKTCGNGGESGDVWTWSVEQTGNVPLLIIDKTDGPRVPVFEPNFINTTGGDSKWEIRMFYNWNSSTKCISYKIFVKDNYSRTHYVYMYEGSFWIPRFTERAEQSGVKDSRTIYLVDDSDSMTRDTFIDTYDWTEDEFAPIESQMDENYRSAIVYEWG